MSLRKQKIVEVSVETKQQQQFLLDQACNVMLGHLFSRPLPDQDLRDWISHQQENY